MEEEKAIVRSAPDGSDNHFFFAALHSVGIYSGYGGQVTFFALDAWYECNGFSVHCSVKCKPVMFVQCKDKRSAVAVYSCATNCTQSLRYLLQRA